MRYTQLTEYERYQIEAFLTAGFTQKAIAKELIPTALLIDCFGPIT